MYRAGLDDIDRQALRHLQKNGRLSNRDLAKALGVSETSCATRVRRLETTGSIAGYAAILGPAAQEHAVRAWVDVRLIDLSPDAQHLFEAAALGAKEVVAAYRTSGLGDYVIKIGADEVAGFDDTLRWLRGAAVQCQAVRQSVILRDVKPLWRVTSD